MNSLDFQKLQPKVQKNIPLAPLTTFQIGGPAKWFLEVKKAEDLARAIHAANKLKIPFFLLAGGSNVLFSDKGFNGLVVYFSKCAGKNCAVEITGNKIWASANVMLGEIVNRAGGAGLSGLEWATGIPGTLGGAIRGNTGAYGGEIKESIKSVQMFMRGKIKELAARQLNFSYRHSICKEKPYIILSATLELKKSNSQAVQKKMQEIWRKRVKKITKPMPSAGSIFKNSFCVSAKLLSEAKEDLNKNFSNKIIPAGYLIDRLDLKGKKIGGAMVSEDNANIIVNVGGATAENVITLISLIKMKVRNHYGIQLQEEIELAGF